jgi:UrcA family protein
VTNSTWRFGIPLAIAFAAASAAAVAQQSNQAPDVKIEAGKVRQTEVQLSDALTPIERFQVDRTVSYADLDLTTTSGETELVRRVTEVAKEACEQLHTDLSAMDDASCMRTAMDSALKQAKAAIEQRSKSTARSALPN